MKQTIHISLLQINRTLDTLRSKPCVVHKSEMVLLLNRFNFRIPFLHENMNAVK